MEKTTSKKLMIVAFSLLAAIIIGLVTTLIVFAATNQTINSSINVSYTATGIYGNATATYKVGATGTETAMKTASNKTEIKFENGVVGDSALNPDNVTLSESDSYVVFKYSFTNKSDKPYYAELSYTDINNDDKNISITYSQNGSEFIETKNYLTVPADTTTETPVGFYVKASVTNLAKDATFTGMLNWNLTLEKPITFIYEEEPSLNKIKLMGVENEGLTKLRIPGNLEKINGKTYEIVRVEGKIPNQPFSIGKDSSTSSNLIEEIVFGSTVEVWCWTFKDFKKLKRVEFEGGADFYGGSGMTEYCTQIFYGCDELKEIVVHKQSIQNICAYGSSAIWSADLEVGSHTFQSNDELGINHEYTLIVVE